MGAPADRVRSRRWTGSWQLDWRGGDGKAWFDFLSAWDEFRHEVDEYRRLDDERVLVLVRLSGSGQASGLQLVQMQATAASLIHVRGDKVTRFVLYLDRERALADLGLEE
jgi:hypothetical protein